jgi:hypothetical protein
MNITTASHVGDILAIPLFLLLTIYLWGIPRKTPVEWLLLAFAASGLILDTIFTVNFLTTRQE